MIPHTSLDIKWVLIKETDRRGIQIFMINFYIKVLYFVEKHSCYCS
jgi:hypothetical protein